MGVLQRDRPRCRTCVFLKKRPLQGAVLSRQKPSIPRFRHSAFHPVAPQPLTHPAPTLHPPCTHAPPAPALGPPVPAARPAGVGAEGSAMPGSPIGAGLHLHTHPLLRLHGSQTRLEQVGLWTPLWVV